MAVEKAQGLRKDITLRYVIALSVIALLSTAAFWVLSAAMKGAEDTAYVVNISGKQRMLSQTIALDAHRLLQLHDQYVKESVAGEIPLHSQYTAIAVRLKSRIAEMRTVNARLSEGKTVQDSLTKVIPLSETLKALYFGSANLFVEVEAYLNLAQTIAESEKVSQKDLYDLSYQAVPLLAKLDKAVSIYQAEGDAKIDAIKGLEAMVLGLTLFMLLLEVLFIFQPMVRHILSLAEDNYYHIKNMEQQVRQRTVSLQEANNKLALQASHDFLTGLYNRLNLEKDIEAMLEKFHQNQAHFAVFSVDIDFFKNVNDRFGHLAGDYVLKSLADLMRASVRANDKVYRAGGEEFVVLLTRCTLADAMSKAETLCREVAEHKFDFEGELIPVTVSIGVYHTAIRPVEQLKDLVVSVDWALYQSKRAGRNTVTLVSAEQSENELFNL